MISWNNKDITIYNIYFRYTWYKPTSNVLQINHKPTQIPFQYTKSCYIFTPFGKKKTLRSRFLNFDINILDAIKWIEGEINICYFLLFFFWYFMVVWFLFIPYTIFFFWPLHYIYCIAVNYLFNNILQNAIKITYV